MMQPIKYQGITYECQNALAKELNISVYMLRYYLKQFNNIDYAIDKCKTSSLSNRNGTYSVDHLGREFNSQSAMCRAWGLKVYIFRTRFINLGWSLEKSLTTPVGKYNPTSSKRCVDHLGNEFPSIKEMLKHYHMNYKTYKKHKLEGWSLENILSNSITFKGK